MLMLMMLMLMKLMKILEDDGDSDPVCANIDCGHGDEADEDECFEPLAVDC